MGQNLKVKRFFWEFTRPANTTAYTAQDSVSDSATVPTIRTFIERQNPHKTTNDIGLAPGGSYMVKSVKLTKSTNATTNASFDVYLYTSGVTANNDNAEHGISYANKIYRIGKTNLTLAVSGTTQSDCAEKTETDVNHTFVAMDTTIYARLVATAAYTPGSAEKFYCEVELISLD